MKGKFRIEMLADTLIIHLIGDIAWWKNSGDEFSKSINQALLKGIKNLDLYIKSDGGDPIEAMEVYNQIKKMPGKKTAYIGAICGSSATIPACACDEIYMSRFGLYMVHEPRLYASGMTEEDLLSGVELIRSIKANVVTIYAERIGKTEDEIRSIIKTDHWMTASQAQEEGWIDGIKDFQMPEDLMELETEMEARIPVSMKSNLIPVDIKMKTKLFAALMLAGIQMKADASEDEFVEAVGKILKENGELKTQLKDQQTATMKAKAKMLVDSAIEQKKIVEADRTEYTELAESNFDLATKMLGKITPVMKISEQLKEGAEAGKTDGKKFSERMKADSTGMLKMRAEDPEQYKKLYKEEFGTEPEL